MPRAPASGRVTPRSPARPRSPRESAEARAARAAEILRRLRVAYPEAGCALAHRDPFQLLVSTILSAQCTDVRVNLVTPGLFARWPDAAAMAKAAPRALESAIHSTGFFRNKAKNILGACRRLLDAYGGQVPRTMDELLTLPGVARKTANVVLGTAYGIADGVVVDTHVGRLSQRLGLTAETDPTKIERDLQALFPRDTWIFLAHALILHGRQVCDARKPACERCALADICPTAPRG